MASWNLQMHQAKRAAASRCPASEFQPSSLPGILSTALRGFIASTIEKGWFLRGHCTTVQGPFRELQDIHAELPRLLGGPGVVSTCPPGVGHGQALWESFCDRWTAVVFSVSRNHLFLKVPICLDLWQPKSHHSDQTMASFAMP